ncbi:MAG: SIS domain-containing protein [Anaerolineaceae bacterium]|nr:SIS domain-containing protein [Anaerolineaceae bacterium]
MNLENGHFTWEEIQSQPAAWQEALAVLTDKRAMLENIAPACFDQVIFTGCGSTYYLAQAASALFAELTGGPTWAYPASELWFSPERVYPTGTRTLLIAVSRSGATTETVNACRAFRSENRGELLTLSCYPEEPLASLGQYNLVLESGQETSIAQTRAFSTLYLAAAWLAALWAGREDLLLAARSLPKAADTLLTQYRQMAKDLGSNPNIDRFYFLGSASRYGLASELSLKMKEMTLSHSEPFHFMEFRHGPKSMITDSAVVVALLSEKNHAQEMAVVEEMHAMGATILAMGENEAVAFHSAVPEAIRNILYLPVGQMMAFYRSVSKDLNPDRPTNLDAVVRLPAQ